MLIAAITRRITRKRLSLRRGSMIVLKDTPYCLSVQGGIILQWQNPNALAISTSSSSSSSIPRPATRRLNRQIHRRIPPPWRSGSWAEPKADQLGRRLFRLRSGGPLRRRQRRKDGKASNPAAARSDTPYSPPQRIGAHNEEVCGSPDPRHVSTSRVERQNLTVRMSMRRFTRLTNAVSKKVENLTHNIALHYMTTTFVGSINRSA